MLKCDQAYHERFQSICSCKLLHIGYWFYQKLCLASTLQLTKIISHSSNLITCSGSWYLNHMYREKAIIFSTNFMRCTLIGLPALSNIGSFVNSSRATSARILNVIGFTTDDATWYTCRPGLWACFAIAASSVFTTISAGIWSEVGSLISFFHFRFKITFDWGVLHH